LELLGGGEAAARAVDDNLGDAVLARGPVDLWMQRMAMARQALDPFDVVGVELVEGGARARLVHDGDLWLVTCHVEPEAPCRIAGVAMSPRVPPGLTPRLPMDFADHDFDESEPARGESLIVFGGLPGVGKSTLADAVGRALRTPVFAIDWLLGALTPFGGRHFDDLWGIGTEQLTTLAVRQLALGQSVILDSPMEEPPLRDRWRSLASRCGAAYVPILCVCPDTEEHRRRLEGRQRGIAGWHNAGNWGNVADRAARFPPWGEAMVVDTTAEHNANLTAILARIRGS
jgi:predicted kinase